MAERQNRNLLSNTHRCFRLALRVIHVVQWFVLKRCDEPSLEVPMDTTSRNTSLLESLPALLLLTLAGCGPGGSDERPTSIIGSNSAVAGTGAASFSNAAGAAAAAGAVVRPASSTVNPTATALGWCDVQPVLATNCSNCHGQQPKYGAPMSLMTYADLQAPSKIVSGQKIYQRVGARVHDIQKPMPPSGFVLPAPAMTSLDSWIAAGAPLGVQSVCPTSSPPDIVPPPGAAPIVPSVGMPAVPPPTGDDWPADCGERYKFVSNSGGRKSSVPAGQPPYFNISIPAPWGAGDAQALMFKPIIDNEKVIHHYILYAADGSFVNGWAPGDNGMKLPPNVGLAMPGGVYRLEVHYNNQTGTTQTDGSGVEVCIAKTPRKNLAAVHWLGSLAIVVPPHQPATVSSTCVPSVKGGAVHLISVSPHMHRTGAHAKMVLNRKGGPAEVLHDLPFSFDDQRKYPLPENGKAVDVVLNAGDTITSTCTFMNDTDGLITFGQATENEMCFFFTVAWPIGQLVNGSRAPDGGSTHACM